MKEKKSARFMSKSDHWYVQNRGIKCPYCGGNSLEGGSLEMDGGSVYQKITCHDCSHNWQDYYVLKGYIKS